MGINKQLDFQILLKIVMKILAQDYGWFAYRRLVQVYFAKGIVLIAAVLGISLLFRIRHIIRQSIIELFGCIIILGFALIRSSSINHIERAQVLEYETISHIHAFELLGIMIVVGALYKYLIKRSWKEK